MVTRNANDQLRVPVPADAIPLTSDENNSPTINLRDCDFDQRMKLGLNQMKAYQGTGPKPTENAIMKIQSDSKEIHPRPSTASLL